MFNESVSGESKSIIEEKIEVMRCVAKGFEKEKTLNILKCLSYLASNNPNYYYNETYLRSYIEDYIEFIEIFSKKEEMIEKLAESIKKTHLNEEMEIIIEIDNLWIISNKISNKSDCMIEILKSGSIKEVPKKRIYCKFKFISEFYSEEQAYYYEYDFEQEYNAGSRLEGKIREIKEDIKKHVSDTVKILNSILLRKVEGNEVQSAI